MEATFATLFCLFNRSVTLSSLPNSPSQSPLEKIPLLRHPYFHSLTSSYFHAACARTIAMTSISFLPVVRRLVRLTETAARAAHWLFSHFFSFFAQIFQMTYRSFEYLAYFLGAQNSFMNWKWFLVKTVARLFTLSLSGLIKPVLGFTSFRFRAFQFIILLLKTSILLPYYAFLLMSLKLIIYLRVDYIVKAVGAPCVRWAARRVWSALNLGDTTVCIIFPSKHSGDWFVYSWCLSPQRTIITLASLWEPNRLKIKSTVYSPSAHKVLYSSHRNKSICWALKVWKRLGRSSRMSQPPK